MKSLLDQAKPIIILLAICGALLVGISVSFSPGTADPITSTSTEEGLSEEAALLPGPLTPEQMEAYDVPITNSNNPIAIMQTNYGTIELELFEDWMPVTAGNFIKLAEEGFYDGIKFHRVIDGFMIQGGDPFTKSGEVFKYGTGGPGYTIQDEHIKADLLTNVRGTISMANNGQPNSGGSQFFINTANNTNLDFDKPPLTSKHPVFGRVVAGMDVVDTIGQAETNNLNLPTEDVVIESLTILRN